MNIPFSKDKKRHIRGSFDIFILMQAILKRENRVDRNREHFWTVCLNSGNKILNIELVSMGSVRATIVEPMEVFSIPLQKRAVSIVIIHNHPGGTLVPSSADKDLTDRLIQCGLMLQVPVIDHVIITEEAHYSFAETGLLEKLKASTKYVPSFILKERLLKQMEEKLQDGIKRGEKAGEQKGKQAGLKEGEEKGKVKGKLEGLKEGATTKAIAMAAVMKQNGEPLKKIMEYTGLGRAAIGKIK